MCGFCAGISKDHYGASLMVCIPWTRRCHPWRFIGCSQKSNQPSHEECTRREPTVAPLRPRPARHPLVPARQHPPDREPHREPRHMGADVGALAAEAEIGQQQHAGPERRQLAQAQVALQPAALAGEGGDDAQGGEDGGRGTDGGVVRRAQGGGEEVAEGAGQQDGEPGETGAEELGGERADGHAGQEVADQMAVVEVEGQGGDGTPPLAGAHQAGLDGTGLEPVDAPQVAAGGTVEEEEEERVGQRRGPALVDGAGRARGPPAGGVLVLVGGELVARVGGVRGGDEQADAEWHGHLAAGDAHGGQDQGQLVGLAPAGAAADLDIVQHGRGAGRRWLRCRG